MYEYQAKVLRVVDGDTYELDVSLGFSLTFNVTLRLYGVDTPETWRRPKDSAEYEHGKKATAFATEMLLGQTVTIRTKKAKASIYGRYEAEVILENGINFSELLAANDLLKREKY